MQSLKSPFANLSKAAAADAHTLREWLVTRLAQHLDMAPEEIDVRRSIADYGLGSMSAVKFSGELEKFTGRQLSPTLVWDFPTVEKIVEHLLAPESQAKVA